VTGGVGGMLNCDVDHRVHIVVHILHEFTLCFWPDSEPTKLLHRLNKMTSKDDIKGLVSLSSFVHGIGINKIWLP
jgi:hypothetical protein